MQNRYTIDQLAKILGLPDECDAHEGAFEYVAEGGAIAYQAALERGDPDDAAEAEREETEIRLGDEVGRAWRHAVERAAESLLDDHGLNLEPIHDRRRRNWDLPIAYKVAPMRSWRAAADAIRATIEGMGPCYFGGNLRDFLDAGPWTPREAVLSHLNWIAYGPELFSGASARRIYEGAFDL